MTGLMTPDKGAAYGTDTISQVQRRLFKTYYKAPRRTALVVLLGLVKGLVVLGWLLSRRRAGVATYAHVEPSLSEVSSPTGSRFLSPTSSAVVD